MAIDVVAASLYLNLVSLLLCVPLGYTQFGLRNILLFAFTPPLALFHAVQLHALVLFGPHIPADTPLAYCLLRKALLVYTGQCVYWFSACIAYRLWMIVSGREMAKRDGQRVEWRLVALAYLVALIPTFLSFVPQLLDPTRPTQPLLNRCSDGYIQPWQILATGAGFSILPTLACFVLVVMIIHHIFRLLRLSSSVTTADQRGSALTMASRVMCLCLAVGGVGGYYIVADFVRYAEVANGWQAPGLVAGFPGPAGHILVAIWGILYFLIFGTTSQSRRVLLGEASHDRAMRMGDTSIGGGSEVEVVGKYSSERTMAGSAVSVGGGGSIRYDNVKGLRHSVLNQQHQQQPKTFRGRDSRITELPESSVPESELGISAMSWESSLDEDGSVKF